MKKQTIKIIDINQDITILARLKRLESLKNHNIDNGCQYLDYASDNLQNAIDWLIKYQVKQEKITAEKKNKNKK
jgi:hypothetical protein